MRRIVRVFLAGLLALLPLTATIAVTIWLVRFAVEYIGPDSMIGGLLTSIGMSIDDKALLPYAVGLAVVLIIVFLFGLLVETSLGPWFHGVMDRLVSSIPVIGSLYQVSKRFVSVVDTQDQAGIKNMTPVWCFFGGDRGAAVLALMPSSSTINLGAADYVGILVPSAPVPVGGALVYVPQDWIKPAELGIDQLVSVYVSMGMTPPASLEASPGGQTSQTPSAPPAIS
ncbi:MAG: DUF502 domain-containing protein [Hyphomicrobiaceae bacterium]